MDFIEKLRKELKFDSKADLAKKLGKTLQAYYSLELATDRITLRDLVALRHIEGMTDQKLLDLIEEEAKLCPRPSKRKSKKGNRGTLPTPSQTPMS
jgi:transcriptional regulator with XRE-family HTH domain